jgi:alcohol dehydrogenase class IV
VCTENLIRIDKLKESPNVSFMRFMADVAPQRFRRIAEALDVPFDDPRAAALASADKVAAFIAGFDVPHSLKAAGVERAEIHDIAEAVADEVAHAKIVERPVTVDEIKGIAGRRL